MNKSTDQRVLVVFPGNEELGKAISLQTGMRIVSCDWRKFPDGETYLRILDNVRGKKTVILCTLDRADDKLLPLYLLCRTLKEQGAEETGLVSPYLGYMRQDTLFRDGEGVTAAYFADLVSRFADYLVTVDPHLHRFLNLGDIYHIPAYTLSASPLISNWISSHMTEPLLIGPDMESEQWVSAIARAADVPYALLQKERAGDYEVDLLLPDLQPFAGRQPLLVDDIISSAGTMTTAVQALTGTGWPAPSCICVHPVFAGNALDRLKASGADGIFSCDTIPHSTNHVSVAGLLSDQILRIG